MTDDVDVLIFKEVVSQLNSDGINNSYQTESVTKVAGNIDIDNLSSLSKDRINVAGLNTTKALYVAACSGSGKRKTMDKSINKCIDSVIRIKKI